MPTYIYPYNVCACCASVCLCVSVCIAVVVVVVSEPRRDVRAMTNCMYKRSAGDPAGDGSRTHATFTVGKSTPLCRSLFVVSY